MLCCTTLQYLTPRSLVCIMHSFSFALYGSHLGLGALTWPTRRNTHHCNDLFCAAIVIRVSRPALHKRSTGPRTFLPDRKFAVKEARGVGSGTCTLHCKLQRFQCEVRGGCFACLVRSTGNQDGPTMSYLPTTYAHKHPIPQLGLGRCQPREVLQARACRIANNISGATLPSAT